LVQVLVGQVVHRLGEPDGIGLRSEQLPQARYAPVGARPGAVTAAVDNCQVGVFMGYVRHDHALLDFRLSLPKE
jgi:hypothetical protein